MSAHIFKLPNVSEQKEKKLNVKFVSNLIRNPTKN